MIETSNSIWKDIKGYEGRYQISNLGQVKSLFFTNNKTKKSYYREKILKQQKTRQGYMTIRLSQDSMDKTYRVHRLVAEAFIENQKNKKEVNHIDGDKQNNTVDNLEWVTRSENQIHAYKNGFQRQTEAMRKHSIEMGKKYGKINGKKSGRINIMKAIKENKVPVEQYSLEGRYIKTWDSMTEASLNTGTCKSLISNCTKGKRESAGGYKWKIV